MPRTERGRSPISRHLSEQNGEANRTGTESDQPLLAVNGARSGLVYSARPSLWQPNHRPSLGRKVAAGLHRTTSRRQRDPDRRSRRDRDAERLRRPDLLADVEPNGDATAYTYNGLGQVTDESVTNAAGRLLFGEHTDWAADGQKRDVVDTRGDGAGHVTSQVTYTWAYDADDRLTGETLTVQSGSGPDVPPAYADAYDYDLDNSRTTETEALATAGAATEAIAYNYNCDDQLKSEIGTGTSNYSTQSGYDAEGNLTSQDRTGDVAESDTYGYDLLNRMTSATKSGRTTAYGYDTTGTLTSESAPDNATTYYLNDPTNPTGLPHERWARRGD